MESEDAMDSDPPTCNDPTPSLDSPVSTIFFGDRKFLVLKDLLCAKLEYFNNMPSSRDAGDDTFRINDVDEEAFEGLISWVIMGDVYVDGEVLKREELEIDSLDFDLREDCESDDEDDEIELFKDERDEPDIEWDEDLDADDDYNPEDLEPYELEPRESEGYYARRFWPHHTPDELDAYQLRALLTEHGVWGRLKEKWEESISRKESEGRQGEAEDEQEDIPPAFDRLIELYILAHRFNASALRNQVITLLQAEHGYQYSLLGGFYLPSFRAVRRAFEALPEASKLRTWLVNVYTFHWLPASDALHLQLVGLPQAFIDGMLKSQDSRYEEELDHLAAFRPDVCAYHEHGTAQEKQRCQELRGKGGKQ